MEHGPERAAERLRPSAGICGQVRVRATAEGLVAGEVLIDLVDYTMYRDD